MSAVARLRIITAITMKDLVEAVKNKNTLSVILPVLFIVMIYRFLPGFSGRDDPPRVFVADPGESSLGAKLGESPFFNVYLVPSEERVKAAVSESDRSELGVVLPVDIDRKLSNGSEIVLEGYAVHWLPAEEVAELELAVEEELSGLAGQPIELAIDSTSIYPGIGSTGISLMMVLSLTFSAVMIGTSFLPHLMLEEKITHTIEALQVSPVRPIDIALGKALVGLFYSLVVGVIGIALYGPLVTHWGVALLIYTVGSAFMIALGLVLGTLLENRQQLMLWGSVILIPLLLPTFLVIMEGLIPDTAIAIMRWIPSVVLGRALSAATIRAVSIADFLPELATLVIGTIAILALAAWLLRRLER